MERGGAACLDITYTTAADIYLGYASSQVDECIRRPRPCFFLYPRGLAWHGDPDFAHWRAGTVLDSMGEFDAAFAEPPRLTPAMRERQEDIFSYRFDLQERPSSERAAEAIDRKSVV